MTPKTYFDDVWQRCELFVALHGYVVANATGALQPDDLLPAVGSPSQRSGPVCA
jgi:hypothetical protein